MIVIFNLDQLNCTFCGTEVIEDKAASTAQDGRTLQVIKRSEMFTAMQDTVKSMYW